MMKPKMSPAMYPFNRKYSLISVGKIAVFLPLLVLFYTFVVHAEEDQQFDDFFKAFRNKRDDIGSLQADFVQKTILPQEIITSEGKLFFSKPRRILFATTDPERATLVDERVGYEYDAEIRQLTVFTIEDHPRANIFFLGFDDDTEALKSAYELTLFESDDPRGSKGIKIKPRADTDEEVYFLEANLFLRDEDYLPYRIHIVNDQESQLYIDVQNILKKKEQDWESVRFFIPEGVKIVESDRVVETVAEGGRYIPVEQQGLLIQERELPATTLDPKN
ncbi:MAG: outer membrane lipoprotein carrier protein LolA [Candidatus Hydrogenedentales bacterium]